MVYTAAGYTLALSAVLLADTSKQQLPPLSVMAMDSSPSSGSCCPDHDHGHVHPHGHAHAHSHPHAHEHHAQPSSSSSEDTELSLERASQLVRYNAFGDSFEDLAAAAVRGAHIPHSHVGCWPAFSLFNHSCVPNTVHYVVDKSMVVRATEDVPAGGLERQRAAAHGINNSIPAQMGAWACMCQAGMLAQGVNAPPCCTPVHLYRNCYLLNPHC